MQSAWIHIVVILLFSLLTRCTPANKHSIESIRFHTTGCFGTCPVFDLHIQADKKTLYTARQYNKPDGNFEGYLSTKTYDQLITLLDEIDFPKLDSNYSVNWTDDQTAVLTITYDNGKTKTIRDYGLQGTEGLRKIYKLLFDSRHERKWIPSKKYIVREKEVAPLLDTRFTPPAVK